MTLGLQTSAPEQSRKPIYVELKAICLIHRLLPLWSTFNRDTFSWNYRLPLSPALGHRTCLRATTEHKRYRKIMTSEVGTPSKHKLHVCSQMETNGCLPWRPHKKNAVTFTVKCNLLFNMQQTDRKERAGNELQQRALRAPQISPGGSRPFKNCAAPNPPWPNSTTDQIIRPR